MFVMYGWMSEWVAILWWNRCAFGDASLCDDGYDASLCDDGYDASLCDDGYEV